MTRTHIHHDSPLGRLTLVMDDGALVGLYYPHHWYMPAAAVLGAFTEQRVESITEELDAYLAGERRTVAVPFVAHGDALQQRVWEIVSRIPCGETLTYGDIAKTLADGTLAKDVGQAVGRNPLCIVIPCHRVVGKGGALTGYAGGIARKRFLLDLERRVADAAVA